MEITGGEEEGFVREWRPCTHMLSLIPSKIQYGIFSNDLHLTCVDAVSEYVALGTNIGLVYWYDRKKGNIQRLRCEVSTSSITFVKIVSTVDYMVAAGNAAGHVTVFQIPKEHPESVPDTLKPKVEPKVERYTIGDLHKNEITAIEWSKNGMRLFSGDKNGVIIMTEIDFYMHLCKSLEIVNEQHEIVQLSYHQNCLLVSSVYRTILCDRLDGKWQVTQVGKKDRKSLNRLGAVFQFSYRRGVSAGNTNGSVLCARAGLRVWRADRDGEVMQTLLFKEAISNPLTIAELLNPSQRKVTQTEWELGPLHMFRENFIVTYNDDVLFILDPRSVTAVAVIDDFRRILSVSVSKDEIFVLEGPRSLVRLGHTPESAAHHTEEPVNIMSKSLTTSIQQAVNTVRDLTIDQTVPFIANQAISIFTIGDPVGHVTKAEECFETPPVTVQEENVLESIVSEFKDVSEIEEIKKARSVELEKKLKIYNSIMDKQYSSELIHSSRRSRRRETNSGTNSPRLSTPVRQDKTQGEIYTSPCLMTISTYSEQEFDNKLLEEQIEEKEKILAKMLNIESLSIETPIPDKPIYSKNQQNDETDFQPILTKINGETDFQPIATKVNNDPDFQPILPKINTFKYDKIDLINKPNSKNNIIKSNSKVINDKNPKDLIPKMSKIPNNWNLEDIQVKMDPYGSPDDVENGWEFV